MVLGLNLVANTVRKPVWISIPSIMYCKCTTNDYPQKLNLERAYLLHDNLFKFQIHDKVSKTIIIMGKYFLVVLYQS